MDAKYCIALTLLAAFVNCQRDVASGRDDRFREDRFREDRFREDRFEEDRAGDRRGPASGSAEEGAPMPQTAQSCVDKVMDIFFLLDSSTSIWEMDFERERQFVRDVVGRLDVNPRATRVGVLTYSDDVQRPVVRLSAGSSKEGVRFSINDQNLPYRTGITNTHDAIEFVRQDSEFRPEAVKVLVMVTDGGSRKPLLAAEQAELAREAGFYVFVVGVGQFIDEREWRSMASDPDSKFIYNITSFSFLENIAQTFPGRVCELPSQVDEGYCGVLRESDLFFVAAPGGTLDATFLMDYFVEKTQDVEQLLRIRYMLDVCDMDRNAMLGDISDVGGCDRFADSGVSGPDTYTNLLEKVLEAAEKNRDERYVQNTVAVLFIDNESMELNRFAIVESAALLQENNILLVVVDLAVTSHRRFVPQIVNDRSNLVRFHSGSILGQREEQNLFLSKTCTALNDIDNIIPTK